MSLSFLTNMSNLAIPQDFFSILDDIRYGLYPRLFNESEYKDLIVTPHIRSISSNTCLEFMLQQKQLIDRRSSLFNNNNGSLGETSKEYSSCTKLLSLFNEAKNEDECGDSSRLDNSSVRELIETRRISAEACTLHIINDAAQKIELNLKLKFSDNLERSLQCFFPSNFFVLVDNFEMVRKEFYLPDNADSAPDSTSFVKKLENICAHLANELVDYGLLNQHDQCLIQELFIKTIKNFYSYKFF